MDLMQCFFAIIPIIGGNLSAAVKYWPITGVLMCKTYSFFAVGLRTANYYLIALIALDRRKIIKKPFSDRCDEHSAKIAVTLLIISGFIVGIPPAFGISSYQYDYAINICNINWCRSGVDSLYAKLYIVVTYIASTVVCGYSYHEIYQVTLRQSKKKRALNSSSLRLYDEPGEVAEPVKSTRRTPRERKRNHNKKTHQNSVGPSRSASIRSIASLTSFSMKSWSTGMIDIQRTRRTLVVTMLVSLLPAPLYFWALIITSVVDESSCGEYSHSTLLMFSYLTVIFNPLVYGYMNHGLQRKLSKLRFIKCFIPHNQVTHESDQRETAAASRSRHRSESDEVVKIPACPASSRRRHSSDSNTVVKYNRATKEKTNDFLNRIRERRFI